MARDRTSRQRRDPEPVAAPSIGVGRRTVVGQRVEQVQAQKPRIGMNHAPGQQGGVVPSGGIDKDLAAPRALTLEKAYQRFRGRKGAESQNDLGRIAWRKILDPQKGVVAVDHGAALVRSAADLRQRVGQDWKGQMSAKLANGVGVVTAVVGTANDQPAGPAANFRRHRRHGGVSGWPRCVFHDDMRRFLRRRR
jgi:hypothetical protein